MALSFTLCPPEPPRHEPLGFGGDASVEMAIVAPFQTLICERKRAKYRIPMGEIGFHDGHFFVGCNARLQRHSHISCLHRTLCQFCLKGGHELMRWQ